MEEKAYSGGRNCAGGNWRLCVDCEVCVRHPSAQRRYAENRLHVHAVLGEAKVECRIEEAVSMS